MTALLAASLTARPCPAETVCKVSYRNFSETADGENPSQFVASIDAMDGTSAELIDDTHPSIDWKTPPRGATPENWIRLAKVKIGSRCDFLAFTFSDGNGTVSYAGHRPSICRIVQYWFSVPPGPDQLPQNAIRECATDLIFRKARETARERAKLKIVVKPWQTTDEDGGEALEGGGEEGLLGGAATVAAAVHLPSMEALAYGAAFEAGWQPTSAAAENIVTLELREVLSVHFSVRLRLTSGPEKTALSRERIPRERLYPNLVRIFRQLMPERAPKSFAYLGSHHARMLGWAQEMALVEDADSVKAFRPASGEIAWQIEKAPKQQPLLRMDPANIFRYDGGLSRIDWETGESTPLAAVNLQEPDFAVSPEGTSAIVSKDAVELYREEKLVRAYREAKFVGEPVWWKEHVIASDRAGTVHALSNKENATVWQQRVSSGRLRLFLIEGLLLADDGVHLHALDPSTGKVIWKHEVGDVLAAPPVKGDGGLVIASKLNRLRILDPVSGAVKVEKSWPTWIKGFAVVPAAGRAVAVVVDLRNRVSLLDTKELKLLEQRSFGANLLPDLWYAEKAPLVWKSPREKAKDEFDSFVGESKSMPAVLCQDEAGFVYLIEIPE